MDKRQELNDLLVKRKDILDKEHALTKDLKTERGKLSSQIFAIELELAAKEKEQKRAMKAYRKNNFVNIILEWDNGWKFDSRKQRYGDLIHLLVDNGVPQRMEQRG